MNAVATSLDLHQRNIVALQEALARAESPRLTAFLRYMLAVHPKDRLPSRSDFDLLAIPEVLPGVVLANVHEKDGRCRFKMDVVGQDVIDASPVPIGKRYLDEIVTDLGGGWIIVDSRQRVIDRGCAYLRQGPPTTLLTFRLNIKEYVHCPLSEDGVTIDHIVSFFSYREREPALLAESSVV